MSSRIAAATQLAADVASAGPAAAQGLGPTGAGEGLMLVVLGGLGLVAVGGAVLVTHRRRSGDD